MVSYMMLIECSQWCISRMNYLCIDDLSRMGLHTAVLICPEKLFVAGQRGHMVRSCFLTYTFSQLGSLDNLNAMGVMLNFMMW